MYITEEDIDAYYDEMAEDAKWEAAREEWKQEQIENAYYEEQALRDTIEDAASENCYADYSSGKRAHLECEHSSYTPRPSSSDTSDGMSLFFFGLLGVIIIAFCVSRLRKGN